MSASSGVERRGPETRGAVLPLPAVRSADLAAHLELVDGVLRQACTELAGLWGSEPPDAADALLAIDLPDLLVDLLTAGGKRLRPVMSYLGWVAAAGRRRGVGYQSVVRVGAALELLHLFALVHDDVMDESDSRRGRPSVHVRARQRHAVVAAQGDSQRFGENIAILLGDLAHAEADHLVAALPAALQRVWRVLVVELVSGQRYDITGSACGRYDLLHARRIARAKSGAYTVERPLQLGATAADAPEDVIARLRTYGRELGEAFALRDDLLGIWGDPARTGKPSGDDLVAGKPTVLLALAAQRLGGAAAARLHRVTSGRGDRCDLARVLDDLETAGLRGEVEDMIGAHVRSALSAVDDGAIDPDGLVQLRRMAVEIAWRDR